MRVRQESTWISSEYSQQKPAFLSRLMYYSSQDPGALMRSTCKAENESGSSLSTFRHVNYRGGGGGGGVMFFSRKNTEM